MFPNLRARVKSYIKLVPKGSQVSLLGLVLALVVVAIIMADLQKSGVDPSLLFILCLALFCLVAFLAIVSRKSIDDAEAPPITVVTDKVALTLPSRRDLPIRQAELIEKMFSAYRHRKELPEPDGLIDDRGQPVEESEDEAKQRVKEANTAVREIKNQQLRFRLEIIPSDANSRSRLPGGAIGDDDNA